MKRGRGHTMRVALMLIQFLASRRRSFTVHDVARNLNIGIRSAYRYVGDAEECGLVEVEKAGVQGSKAVRWRSLMRKRAEGPAA